MASPSMTQDRTGRLAIASTIFGKRAVTNDEARRIAVNIAQLTRLAGPPAVLDALPAWYPPFPMAFAIQWTGPLGPASTQRKDPVDALRYATQMLGKGYADFVIVDLAEGGKAYAPTEFREFYLGGKN